MKGKYIERNIQLAMPAGKIADMDLKQCCENHASCNQKDKCELTDKGNTNDKETWLVFGEHENE